MERANTVTQPYWDGIERGQLLLQHCGACSTYQYYARPLCAKCHSAELEWREASGRGVLYSYSVVQRGPAPSFQAIAPYVTAIVELEEGPRMFTNIVDVDAAALQVGESVSVVFREGPEGLQLPYFRPAGASVARSDH